jgi:phosphatidylserine/phosphatidylglycerophosphate/cardiolipin synthase-like enzyme
VPVELYFSPSDGTTSKIIKTLNKATGSIDFGILTFTRTDIANLLIAKKKAGIKVHGVMDNKIDQGCVFDALVASGLDVHLKGIAIAGLLHHKYGLVDAESFNPDQYVITGSHNWSSSAENSNNENTLIIKSQRIANLYLQEFSSRYTEAGGADALTGVTVKSKEVPAKFYVSNNFPNPFNPNTIFEFSLPNTYMVSIKVFDILGREVVILLNEIKSAGTYRVTWNASTLSSGLYFYRVQAGKNTAVKKAILLK